MAAGQQHRGECRVAPALVGLSGNILVPPRSRVKFARNRCTQYQMLPCVFWPRCKGGRAAAAGWQLRGEHITRIGLCMDAFCAHTKRLRAGDACNRFEEEKSRVIGEHNHTHLVWRRIGRHGLSTCWIALVFTNCMRMPHGMASWHARVEPFATLGVRRGVRAHIIALAS